MLVMKRHVGERILIGDDIIITLTEAGGGWAKIGVEAPRHIAVDREEIHERRLRERSGREGRSR